MAESTKQETTPETQEKQFTPDQKASILKLSNQIIHSENRIEQLLEQRERLGDTSKSSEKYKELTALMKKHRQRIIALYERLESISPGHADRLEISINNHFALTKRSPLPERTYEMAHEAKPEPIYAEIPGDKKGPIGNEKASVGDGKEDVKEVAVSIGEKREGTEIQSTAEPANKKNKASHKDMSAKPRDNTLKNIEIQENSVTHEASKKKLKPLTLRKAKKKLKRMERKLAKFKRRQKTVTGRIINFLSGKNKKKLLNKKNLLVTHINTLKGKPGKSIPKSTLKSDLKPLLNEKLTNAQKQVRMNNQARPNPALNKQEKTRQTI